MIKGRPIMRIWGAWMIPFYLLSIPQPVAVEETSKNVNPALILSYDAIYGGYKFARIYFSESKPYEYEEKQVI